MKATIRDSSMLRAVRPHDMVAYLRAQHWREYEHQQDLYAIWQREIDNEPVEILLPLNSKYRDYATRIAEALHTLEVVEQRSQHDILTDIQNIAYDVTRSSAEGKELAGGTISLQGGAQFVVSVQRLFLAAAHSAVQQRPVYDDHVSEAAAAHVQQARIRIGHGSFTVAVYTPVASDGQPHAQSDSQETPFAPRVTLLLIQALHNLRSAVERAASGGSIEPLLEVAPGGISADPCDALIGLYAGSQADRITFNVAWSPLRPAPADTVSAVEIPAGAVPFLQDIRDAVPRENVVVQGFVVDGVWTDAGHGRVMIGERIDGAPRLVVCELVGENYWRAVEAHYERRAIRCTGDLRRAGEEYVLLNPRNVTILEQAVGQRHIACLNRCCTLSDALFCPHFGICLDGDVPSCG